MDNLMGGVLATAGLSTALKLWDTDVLTNNSPQVGLMLEMQPTNHPPYQVDTKQFISHIRLSQVQPGSVVNVRLDPTDPSKISLALL